MKLLLVSLMVGYIAWASFYFGAYETSNQYQGVIIEKGYGEICPDNGKFAFIGECGEGR